VVAHLLLIQQQQIRSHAVAADYGQRAGIPEKEDVDAPLPRQSDDRLVTTFRGI
jgi:hypothetical protein